ncbi:hypothetical protein ACWGOQ_0000690 [Aquimarina sp. M1]
MAGGTIFPGIHNLAQFTVNESDGNYHVEFVSDDDTSLSIDASETENWNEKSIFENLQCVSDFFQNGAIGYAPDENEFDGLELKAYNWKISLFRC